MLQSSGRYGRITRQQQSALWWRLLHNTANFLEYPLPSRSTRRKLLVVAGAGAAVEFGMLSLNGVHALLLDAAAPYFTLADNPPTNLYGYLYQQINEHYSSVLPQNLDRKATFEDVLYAIYALASTYPAGIFTGALGAVVAAKTFPDVIHITERKPVDADVLRHLGQHLVDAIVADFRARCQMPAPAIEARTADMQRFFTTLAGTFDLAVVTTNYDDLIHRCLPSIETGFDLANDGLFSAGRIIGRTSWPCLLHLHGSIHFDMDTLDGELHGIKWHEDLHQPFHQNSFGRTSISTTEGNEFPTSAIIAGYGKSEQIQRQPFRTYYSELDRLVDQSEAVLFLGFSLGDAHVRTAFGSYRDGRDRPIVVIDHADDGCMLAGYAPFNADTGAARALRVFRNIHGSTEWLGYRQPQEVDFVKAAREFERCNEPGRRISIWYNGMLEACRNVDMILMELLR
jgi:hypothetical protein